MDHKKRAYFSIGVIFFTFVLCMFVMYLNGYPTKGAYDPIIFDIFAFLVGSFLTVDGTLEIQDRHSKITRRILFPVLRIFIGVNIFTVHLFLFILKFL